MCLQCTVEAVTVKENFLPGYTLMKATNFKAPNEWPVGALGLVEMNNPTLVFNSPIVARPPKDADCIVEAAYNSLIFKLLDEVNLYPIHMGQFLKLCRKNGFNGQDDWAFGDWLMQRLYEACYP